MTGETRAEHREALRALSRRKPAGASEAARLLRGVELPVERHQFRAQITGQPEIARIVSGETRGFGKAHDREMIDLMDIDRHGQNRFE